jgi:hypothetical protein
VIVGREWEESTGKEAKEVVQIAFAFLLSKNVPRHIEGLMESDQFPVNYFSMSEVEQWYVHPCICAPSVSFTCPLHVLCGGTFPRPPVDMYFDST